MTHSSAKRVLIADFDFFSVLGGGQVFYQRVVERNPDSRFFYLSRGPDLDLPPGRLPPNAVPLPYSDTDVDERFDLTRSGHWLAQDLHGTALRIARAVGGERFDIVDVPSFRPIAHLIRPALEANGASAERVALSLVGWLSVGLENGWRQDVAREFVPMLKAMEKLSFDASDRRYTISRTHIEENRHHGALPVELVDMHDAIEPVQVDSVGEAWRQPGPVVVVPSRTYNRAAFLPETIGSILDQGYPGLRLVVVDDGSTDDTRQVVEGYRAAHPGVVRYLHQENSGEAAAVNRAWREADTEYFAVVSSDDPMLPGWLETGIAFLDARPEIIVGYPDWYIIDGESKPVHLNRVYEYSRIRLVSWAYCLPGPGTLVRRSALADVDELRSPSYRYVSDFECWLRLCLRGDFVRIPHTLATWRLHDGAATVAASRRAMAGEFIRVVARFFRRADLPDELRRYRPFAMSRAYCHAANVYWAAQPRIGAFYNLLSHLTARDDPPELPAQLHRVGIKDTIDRGAPWLCRLDRLRRGLPRSSGR